MFTLSGEKTIAPKKPQSKEDKARMMRAIALARRGAGLVAPNPEVGAILVKDGKVIGKGWHEGYGLPHAEVNAISSAGSAARGATLYVTLEPCNHSGKTEACSEAVLKSGVSRVVIGALDSNPNVNGGGAEFLRNSGVEVLTGVCESEVKNLLAAWEHSLKSEYPYLVLKLALSKNGKMTYPESSSEQNISSAVSRASVQRLRSRTDAVIVGVGTVLADNCRLTNRSGRGRNPARVVIDANLKCPLDANVLANAKKEKVIIFCEEQALGTKAAESLLDRGVVLRAVSSNQSRLDLGACLCSLREDGFNRVICEGGVELAESLVRDSLCDRIVIYKAPFAIDSAGRGLSFVDASGELELGAEYDKILQQGIGGDELLVFEKR